MYRFSKQQRILKNLDFRKVLDDGLKVVCPELVVLGQCNGLGGNRLGLIVSKKVGSAPVRNRVKRSLRECFRQTQDFLTASFPASSNCGFDIVVIARSRAATASYHEICHAYDSSTQRLMRRFTEKRS